MKITIIGAGNMGGAIARGLATGTIFRPADITVTAHTQASLDKIKSCNADIHTTLSNVEAVQGADLIVLAVKPWLVAPVVAEIKPRLDWKRQIIISVAAGISFDALSEMLSTEATLFRVIPNTAIAVKQSMTLLSACRASEAQTAIVQQMFDELGKCTLIEERLMAAGTAVTSCGIAYAFQYVKAAIQAAIELGLYPQVAKEMIDQTVLGAISLMEANGSMPDAEIYKVCTPGGITIKGLNEMAALGFDHAVIEGLKKAAGK